MSTLLLSLLAELVVNHDADARCCLCVQSTPDQSSSRKCFIIPLCVNTHASKASERNHLIRNYFKYVTFNIFRSTLPLEFYLCVTLKYLCRNWCNYNFFHKTKNLSVIFRRFLVSVFRLYTKSCSLAVNRLC